MLGPHSDVYRPTRADTREAIAHARQACLAAVRAIARATTVLESSRMLCAERDHWRQVWNDLKGADRDYMAVCCAYCTRVRSRDGVWGAIPPGVHDIIHGTSRINLTHGICPDCLPVVFPAAQASSTATIDAGS
jgi:hypothetical protein